MTIGKSYWLISIRNDKLVDTMPRIEYREMQKALRSKASSILGNKFEFKTKKEALAAQKKLPKEMQGWIQVRESFPVSLGLSWI